MRLLDPHDPAPMASPVSMVRQPSHKRHRTQAQTSVLAEEESARLGPMNDMHQGPKWVASLRALPDPTQAAGTAGGLGAGGVPSATLQHTVTQELPGKLAGGTGMQEGYAHRAWETRQWSIDSQALWGTAQV